MNPHQPSPLKPGDRLSVVAPAGPVDPEALEKGVDKIRQLFQPSGDRGCLPKKSYFAGDDTHRLSELQQALDDTTARAILAARGGYGTSRLVDKLDFSRFLKRPQWIVGSSDLTALLMHLYARYGLQTIHGPMVFRFDEIHQDDLDALFDLLGGKPWTPPKNLKPLLPGEARGPLIGGNLTLLAHLTGTLQKGYTDGAILFLEDVGEPTYRLDRALTQLIRTGAVDAVNGVVLGEFTGCDSGPDGYTPEKMFQENLEPFGIPVATGYPAAHGKRNYPFVHGAEITLSVSQDRATIQAR